MADEVCIEVCIEVLLKTNDPYFPVRCLSGWFSKRDWFLFPRLIVIAGAKVSFLSYSDSQSSARYAVTAIPIASLLSGPMRLRSLRSTKEL